MEIVIKTILQQIITQCAGTQDIIKKLASCDSCGRKSGLKTDAFLLRLSIYFPKGNKAYFLVLSLFFPIIVDSGNKPTFFYCQINN